MFMRRNKQEGSLLAGVKNPTRKRLMPYAERDRAVGYTKMEQDKETLMMF